MRPRFLFQLIFYPRNLQLLQFYVAIQIIMRLYEFPEGFNTGKKIRVLETEKMLSSIRSLLVNNKMKY